MIKELFLLDPQVIFLNHGSYGACPRPVFEKYQEWQRVLEQQPVQFLGVDFDHYMLQSRLTLGVFLHASSEDLVYIPNATHGVNIVARSLSLKPGDQVLTTDHEYGACNYAWEFNGLKTGAIYKKQAIHMPVDSEEEIIDQFWEGVTPNTKVIYLSHITSPTSLTIPVKALCQRARQAGILTVIDGAHAPGQIEVNLPSLEADFYTGNCHKWMLSPKGAGFLYARPEVQSLVEPLVVSWGYQSATAMPRETKFIDFLQWTGTIDPAAVLAVPAAIEFMQAHHWSEVKVNCHSLLHMAIDRICEMTGLAPLYPLDTVLYHQMGTVPIPRVKDINGLKSRLYVDYKIEIPCFEWNNQHYLRISVQGYNSVEDIQQLIRALGELLPVLRD